MRIVPAEPGPEAEDGEEKADVKVSSIIDLYSDVYKVPPPPHINYGTFVFMHILTLLPTSTTYAPVFNMVKLFFLMRRGSQDKQSTVDN